MWEEFKNDCKNIIIEAGKSKARSNRREEKFIETELNYLNSLDRNMLGVDAH